MSLNILHLIYVEAFEDFNEKWYKSDDSNTQRDCDTALYNGEIKSVEVLLDEKDPEDEWNNRLVFKYKDKIYACPYRTGSYGSGICFYDYDLKEVQAKVKEVTYYE